MAGIHHGTRTGGIRRMGLRRLGGEGIPRGKPYRHPGMRFVCRPRVQSAISIKMLSYCTRIAARPPLSQLASRRMAVTISYGLNDEYLLQRCSSTCLKRQGGDWYSHLLTNDSRTTRPNLEPCTPTLTSCSLSPTLCEAPARMPADSLSRSPLRDSPQRPQRSGRPRSTRRPELIARRRRSREKE